MLTKLCTKCNLTKTVDQFHAKNSGLHRFSSLCKLCKSEYGKQHYQENKEKLRAYSEQYRKNNPEKIRDFGYKNKKIIADRAAAWRAANPDKVKGYSHFARIRRKMTIAEQYAAHEASKLDQWLASAF